MKFKPKNNPEVLKKLEGQPVEFIRWAQSMYRDDVILVWDAASIERAVGEWKYELEVG